MQFDAAVEIILGWEGGFSNHPKDPGGATNLGITLRTLSEWRGHPATVDDVKALTVGDVAPIYRARYWDACRCTEMPSGLDLIVFDCAVNQGPARAKRLLQQSLRVVDDGILGPMTMGAIGRFDSKKLVDEMVARRAVHYASLQSDFHLGWFRRLAEVHRLAIG